MYPAPPIEIKASEFKAKCLQLLDEVLETGREIVITKRGKPMARLVPPQSATTPRNFGFGCLKGMMRIEGDVLTPLDVEWGALSDKPDPLLS